ncbi:TniQ family protein, partial [Escherichia coli]|nr:TniQ family protein [Escherichia coli]
MILLPVLPDETLFSRICRSVTVYGMSPSTMLQILFGKSDVSVHPILSSGLNDISLHTSESAEQLLYEQTLLPLFSWALPSSRKEIMDLRTTPGRLNRLCRLSNFSSGLQTVLKFCPVCAREDAYHHGVTYWHLLHQLRGITTCYRHQILLESICVPPSPHIRKGLMPPVSYIEHLSTEFEFDFAKFCYEFINMIRRGDANHPDYMDILKQLNLLSVSGNIKKGVFYSHVYAKCRLLDSGSSAILPESISDYHYWEPLLRNQSCQHPTKHLLLCYCLLRITWPVHADIHKKSKSIAFDDDTAQFCLLSEKHNSINSLAKELNKSRCFIKGVIHKKYVKNYKCSIKINILTEFLIKSMAVRGFSLASIAKKNSLSEGSVSSVISSFYGLCSWRKKCKRDSLRRRHKQKILRFMHGLTGPVTRKVVRANCYASFFWLNRFESQWLDFYLPKESRRCNVKRVNWDERDKFSLSL